MKGPMGRWRVRTLEAEHNKHIRTQSESLGRSRSGKSRGGGGTRGPQAALPESVDEDEGFYSMAGRGGSEKVLGSRHRPASISLP
uniref:Uncharacterized protein n=1 Tax=Setaria italica TaxID=4555 RepID=K3Y453_SETIT